MGHVLEGSAARRRRFLVGDAFARNREAGPRTPPESRGRTRADAPASPRAGDEAPGAGAARARFSRPRSIFLSRRDIYGAAALKFVSGGARARRRSKFRGGTSRGAPSARVKYERCPRRALMSTDGSDLPHSGSSQLVEPLVATARRGRVRTARGSTSPPAAFSGSRAKSAGASGPRARGRPGGVDPEIRSRKDLDIEADGPHSDERTNSLRADLRWVLRASPLARYAETSNPEVSAEDNL